MCSVQRSSKEMDEGDKYYVESKVKSKKGGGQREKVSRYGFHNGTLLGDFIDDSGREARLWLRSGVPLRGVAGRRKLSSPSTRLRNWRAVKGEPGEECVLIDWGLFPLGLDRANGESSIPPPLGSGVFGSREGVMISSGASKSVEELIHFSSLEPR